ncbi:MAG: HAD family hydrolase [Clostridia bacterium]|nr:HAD family hydrolase [Clostridia bacterium]
MSDIFKNRKTIIFDMDGTVLNTLDDLTLSMNFVMTEFGFPTHSVEEYRSAFGNGVRYALEKTAPHGTPSDVIDKMIPIFKEHYDAHCLDNTRPYDGVIPLMKQLKERGFRMAIVSNKIDSAVKELNEKFFSDVVDIAIGERAGIKRKPAPDMVFLALDELGASADDAVYVGDSEVDLKTAQNSSLPCVSVLWGFRDRDFLKETGGETFAVSPRDLLDIFS